MYPIGIVNAKLTCLDAGNGPYPPIDVVEKRPPSCFRCAKLADIHVKIEDTVRPKSEIRPLGLR